MNESPNHALQRTAPAVTLAAPPPSPAQPSRQPPPSLSLGSFGDFAHLLRVMSANRDSSSSIPPTELHALKTSSSRVCREFGGLASASCESFQRSAFPKFCIRKSPASSAAPFFGVYREVHTSSRSIRSNSERLDRAAVFGFLPLHASGEPHLSRDLRSRVHREFKRCPRNSFRASVLNPTSPNHALQRTAPRVTVAAFLRSTRPLRLTRSLPRASSLSLTPQLPRRAPQSLSLGSLGAATRTL